MVSHLEESPDTDVSAVRRAVSVQSGHVGYNYAETLFSSRTTIAKEGKRQSNRK